MFDRKSIMDLKPQKVGTENTLILVTLLYTVSSTLSSSYQFRQGGRTCEPIIPFGECPRGEIQANIEIASSYTFPQILLSLVVTLLAGTWSDSHGRRRKPLILIPIFGQILSNSLYFVNNYWNWPRIFDDIFTSYLSGVYVGRNLFWIGAMAYVSENSTVESRTLKIAKLIGTYTISHLIGLCLFQLLDNCWIIIKNHIEHVYRYYHVLFLVPIFLNIIAALVVIFFMKDTSDSYDRNMLWMKPTNVFNSFISLFKNESRNRAVFGMLFTCQLAVVVRVGVEYFSIMNLLAYAYMGDITYVYFNISKMVAVVFGALFSGVVLSKCMKVNDIVIGLLTCSVYIVVATCYIFVNRLYQHCIIVIIYLCHGSIIVIMTSLTSKMVETEELGRFNSIQSTIGSVLIFSIAEICRFNNHNKMVHLFMVFFLYAILTLPIVLVLMFLYFKCKDWLKTENITLQKNSVYTILSSH